MNWIFTIVTLYKDKTDGKVINVSRTNPYLSRLTYKKQKKINHGFSCTI